MLREGFKWATGLIAQNLMPANGPRERTYGYLRIVGVIDDELLAVIMMSVNGFQRYGRTRFRALLDEIFDEAGWPNFLSIIKVVMAAHQGLPH